MFGSVLLLNNSSGIKFQATHLSISSLQWGLASPPLSFLTPSSSKSLSERSSSFSRQEAELITEARASELCPVRLQLLSLNTHKKCWTKTSLFWFGVKKERNSLDTDLRASSLLFFSPPESFIIPASVRLLLPRSSSLSWDELMPFARTSQQVTVRLHAFRLQ